LFLVNQYSKRASCKSGSNIRIVSSFNRNFFTCEYTNVLFWAEIVHVSGMFIYPAVQLGGVHCNRILSLILDNRFCESWENWSNSNSLW